MTKLDKLEITSSESKEKLERSGKGLITSLSFKAKIRPHKYKKASYVIGNVSKNDISKIIRKFEEFEKLTYDKKRPKHEPTDSYLYPEGHLSKCMMRADALNWHGYGGYTEMNDPSSNVFSTDEDKSKRIILHKTLLNSCSAIKDESKQSIVDETLLHNYSADVEELCST